MMMEWTQRNGSIVSIDLDGITRLEYVPNVEYGRPMLTLMTCDVVDTISGRPALPGDPTYVPDSDTAEVLISQPESEPTKWKLFRIPEEILELRSFIVKYKANAT
jgi:hypothetical protein